MSERCADVSLAAGEVLSATAVSATRWLVVEVPGSWPRDVSVEGALPVRAHEAIAGWLADTPGSRVQFVRRPRRDRAAPVAFAVRSEEGRGEIRRIALDHHDDLASLDWDSAGEPIAGSLVLVCGHGTRDRCCALYGTAVFAELDSRLGEEELWLSSHQGGHRFAANVLVLPHGLQFGRVAPQEAPLLVARALAGRIELDRYRGRTCYEPAAQAAEHAVRAAAGLEAVGDLELAAVEDGVVRFRSADGAEWRAAVEEGSGPAVPASCGADPEPQRALTATVL